jgi:hypothetical protein
MAWLVNLILKALALVLNGPSPLVVEAEKAGAAQARADALEAQNEAARKAAAAAVAAAAADAGGLRASGDPDCRDCST